MVNYSNTVHVFSNNISVLVCFNHCIGCFMCCFLNYDCKNVNLNHGKDFHVMEIQEPI